MSNEKSRTIDIYCPTCGYMGEVERAPWPTPLPLMAGAATLGEIQAAACSVPGVMRCMAELEPSGCDVTAVTLIDDAQVNREEVRAAIKDASPIYVATRIIFTVEAPAELAPQPPPVHVAVFDDGRFEFVRRFSVLAEAEAFKDGVKACPSLHSTGSSAYLLPWQETEMHEWQPEARKALAAAEEAQ